MNDIVSLSIIFFLSFMSTIFSLNYISDDMWTITPFLYVPIYLPNTIVMLSIYVYNTYIFINLYILIILDCVRYPWTKPMFYCGKDFHVRYLYRLRDLSYLYLDQYMWSIFEYFFFDKRYLWFNWWFYDSQIIFEAMDRNQTTMKQEISFDLKNKSVLTPKGTSVWLVLMQINENHIYSYSYVTSFLKQWPNFSLFLINYISCGCYILVKLQSKYNKNNEIMDFQY
jgi:hypothetical protein